MATRDTTGKTREQRERDSKNNGEREEWYVEKRKKIKRYVYKEWIEVGERH